MFPSVSLEHVSLDEDLARRLPRQLAYYHLAIPIGVDDEGVTVAMAQPENAKAREIIQQTLKQPVIPVLSEAEQIRRFLDMLWPLPDSARWQKIVASSDNEVVSHYTHRLADIYDCRVVSQPDDGSENTLFIRHFAEDPASKPFSSTLLVNRVVQPMTRILHLVRLHTPDQLVVSSLLPLMKAESAQVTLLPDTATVSFNLAYLLDHASPHGQHLAKLKHQLEEAGVFGLLRLRQVRLVEAVVAEFAEQDYDLVAVAADAYGEFVQTLVTAVEPYAVPAMMIVKPDLR